MSQLQQLQQFQALQQFMQRNSVQLDQFQSQPPTSQPQPSIQLDDDDDEVVPESPPKELNRKKNRGKGKAVETQSDTAKKKAVREQRRERNNQTGSGFWSACTDRFNNLMGEGPYRDLESVSGKWRKMNKCVNDFIGIYNPLYINRPSGSSDEDVLNLTMARWETKNPSFPHLRAWNILKKEPKWAPIPNEVATAKRTKTSESGSYSAGGSTARCQIDINDEPEYEEEPVHGIECPG
ncbi:glutathione S-transferase T3-like [Helianthus annuus]|uniref:glutathione S-transferase T3-like n=1 Tax=Helianthus annuus TaxID=4232 RepID=UPI000B8F6C9F|nr:glutathione S-transferase T3-like [Helianthus annuus]